MCVASRRRTIRFLEPMQRKLSTISLTRTTYSGSSARTTSSHDASSSGQEDEGTDERASRKRSRRLRSKERERKAKKRAEAKVRSRALRALKSSLGKKLRDYRQQRAIVVIKVALQEWFTEGPHFRVVRFACRRVRKCSLVIQKAWRRFTTVMQAREALLYLVFESVERECHHLLWRLQENLAAERFQRRIERETNTPWIREHRLVWNNTQRRVNSFLFDHHKTFAPAAPKLAKEDEPGVKKSKSHPQQQRPTSRGRRGSVSSFRARRKTVGAIDFEDLNAEKVLDTIQASNSEGSLGSKGSREIGNSVAFSPLHLSDVQRSRIVKSTMHKKWEEHKKSQWMKRGVLEVIVEMG